MPASSPELVPSLPEDPVRVRWAPRGGGLTAEVRATVRALDQWQIGQRHWRNRIESLIAEIPYAAQKLTDAEVDPDMRALAAQWMAALSAQAEPLGLTAHAAARYSADLEQICPSVAAALTLLKSRLRRDRAEGEASPPQKSAPGRPQLDLQDLLPPGGVPSADALRLLTHRSESVRRQVFRPAVEADMSMQDRGVFGEWFSAILEARVPESGSASEPGWAPYSGRPALLSGSRHLPRVAVAADGLRELSPPRLRALNLDATGLTLPARRQQYLGLMERLVRIPLRGQMQEMLGVWQAACDAWFAEARADQVVWTPTLCELAASCADAGPEVPLGTGVREGWWGQSPSAGRTPAPEAPLADEALVELTATAREAAWKRRTPQAMRLQFARRSPQAMDVTWLEERAGSLEAIELGALRDNPGYGDDQRRALLRASVDVLLREPVKQERWRNFLLVTRRELSAPWLAPEQDQAIRLRYRNRLSNMPVPLLASLVSEYQPLLFPAADATPLLLGKTWHLRRQVYQDAARGFTAAEWALALQQCYREDTVGDRVIGLLEQVPPDATPEAVRQHTRTALLSPTKEIREAAIRAVGRFQSAEAEPLTIGGVSSRRRRPPRY